MDELHVLGLDGPDYDCVRNDQEEERGLDDDPEVKEDNDPVATRASTKRARTMNYSQDETLHCALLGWISRLMPRLVQIK